MTNNEAPAPEEMTIITLTDQPPVRIRDEDWPEIARAELAPSSSGWEKDATRRGHLRVRRHADGRTLVYGWHVTRWQGERDASAGVYLAAGATGADLITAIHTVAAGIGWPRLAQLAIEDLPPVDLI